MLDFCVSLTDSEDQEETDVSLIMPQFMAASDTGISPSKRKYIVSTCTFIDS